MAKKKPQKSLDELLEEALVKEDEQPYEVPGNWEWVRLENLGMFLGGSGFPKQHQGNTDLSIPFYKVSSLRDTNENGMLTFSANYIDNEIKEKIKAKVVPKDSIVFAKIGEAIRLNRRAILSQTSCIDNNMMAYCPNSDLLSLHLFYLWSLKEDFYKYTQATTVPSIRKSTMDNIKFPLPPLPEQKQIVRKLSSMLGKLKEARELIQEAKETFEERRAAILNKAFTGELTKKWREENPDVESVDNIFATIFNNNKKNNKGKKNADIIPQEKMEIPENEIPYNVPAGWKWARFGDVCKAIKDGTHFSPQKQHSEDGKNRYLYITSKNIRDQGMVFNNVAYIDEAVHKEIYQRCDPKLGDILLVKDGAKTGTVAINTIDKEFSLLSSVAVLKVFENTIEPNYIKNFLKSPMGRNIIFGQISGSAITRITLAKINKFTLPIPPLEEQKRIVRILEKLLDHEDEARALIDMEEQIDLLEKSILSKAFRGGLGTNDPNDEPAIELLKRSLKEKMNK